MSLSENDISTLTSMLSAERLKRLIDLTGSRASAIDLHQDTLRVGSSLLAVIATIEIALRNSVCENLAHHFAVSDWLFRPPAPFQWRKPESQKVGAALESARRGQYSKLSQADKHGLDQLAYPNGRPASKSHLDRAKDRRKHIPCVERASRH